MVFLILLEDNIFVIIILSTSWVVNAKNKHYELSSQNVSLYIETFFFIYYIEDSSQVCSCENMYIDVCKFLLTSFISSFLLISTYCWLSYLNWIHFLRIYNIFHCMAFCTIKCIIWKNMNTSLYGLLLQCLYRERIYIQLLQSLICIIDDFLNKFLWFSHKHCCHCSYVNNNVKCRALSVRSFLPSHYFHRC